MHAPGNNQPQTISTENTVYYLQPEGTTADTKFTYDEDEQMEMEEGERPTMSAKQVEEIYRTQNAIHAANKISPNRNTIYDEGKEVYVSDSIEHITGEKPAAPIYLDLHFTTDIRPGELEPKDFEASIFGKIRGMFDSGASINCIDAHLAHKCYKKYIKRDRNFYCKTAFLAQNMLKMSDFKPF